MSQTELVAVPPATAGSRTARHRWRRPAWLAAGAAALAGVAALPWEWSFIDDTGALEILHGQQDLYGTVRGIPHAAIGWYQLDLDWGLFRPAWWLYGAAFYVLPPGPAHAARVLMLALAVAGPLVLVARAGRAALVWAGAALAADVSLYRGLWYPSLQELSGLCFVGLGLLARRRQGPRILCFLLAAWFKTPFAWLLLAYGALLLARRGTRWWGAVCVALGAGTVVAAVDFARTGSYTAGLAFDTGHLLDNARTAAGQLAPLAVVLVAGALALRVRPRWPADPTGPALVLGGLGYLANLLPWYTGVHYASPYLYLIGAGAVLTLAPTARPAPRWWTAVGLAAAVAVGLVAVFAGGRYIYRNAATTTGLRDCVLGLPDGSVVGYNRPEAWNRLNAIVRYHRPQARTRAALVPNGATVADLDYYIWEPEYGPGSPALRTGPVVCRTPLATVFRIR
jgi:hypothetical protein